MINKSIAYKLSIYISIAVVGVFLAFILIAFYFNNAILKRNTENEAIVKELQAMMLGERQLVSTREITSNISEQILYFALHNDVDLFISKLMAKYNYLNAIHINIDQEVPGISNHNYYYFRTPDSLYNQKGNQISYLCEIEREIFEKKKKENLAGWTEIFECHRNNKHVVAYYSPIKIVDKNNQLVTIGSIVTELKMQDINDTINSLKIGKNGYAFVVSKDGTYLTYPDADFVLNKNLFNHSSREFNASDDAIRNVLEKGKKGSLVAYPEKMNFKKCWIYYSPIKETGWTIIFVVPYNELFLPLYILILRMLFFSVIGILIIFFIVTLVTNKLIQPLSTVTNHLKEFSIQGERADLNTRNEIKLVSESLDYIKSWYRKFEIEQQHEEKLNSQRKHDLQEASEIQLSLINKDFSAFEGRKDVDMYAIYKPARIVSGDLFDFIFIDSNNLFFTIGDVSGKGLPASFFMSVAQTLLKGNSKLGSPGKVVYTTNNELFTVNQHQFFLTLFCGILNIKTGILTYCNAAHTPTLILSSTGEITAYEQPHGMPLGLYPNREYEESAIRLMPGDSVILYTDGVTEQQNSNNQHFGRERFFQMLIHLVNMKPKLLVEEIEKNLDLFKGKMHQTDDITLLSLKFNNRKKAR